MFLKLFRASPSLATTKLTRLYEVAVLSAFEWLSEAVRVWEEKPLHRRKRQLIAGMAALLLLSSLSVYYTATGHFLTRTTKKVYEQQPRTGSLRRK